MPQYDSIHLGSVIDDAITTVINGEAGIQGVKVNDVELTPDEDNKVDVTVPVLKQSTGSSTTDGMTQAAITTALSNKIDTSSIVQASGTSTTDLMSQKAVTDELDTKVDIESGKGLSTNDYTTAEKTKLAGIETEANKTSIVQTTGTSTTDVMSQKAVTDELDTKVDAESGKGLSTNDYTTAEKSKLAGIETEANKTTVVQATGTSTTSVMSQKAVTDELDAKVDIESGKGLSTNDYTTAEKSKLADIEAEANKTTIVQATGTSTTDVMSQKAVTDELDTKVDAESGKGLSTNDYTTAEKSKLADIEAEANKTIIVQTTGTSTTSVMSQKAVTDALSGEIVTEMGTWEPELVKSADYLSMPTYTFTVKEAKYYRVGKVCYVSLNLRINVTAVPGAVSGIVVDGLPYTSDSDLTMQSLPTGHIINADPNPGGFGGIKSDSTKINVYKETSLAFVLYKVESQLDVVYSGLYLINSSYY